jgi:magnesium transporter
MVADIYALKRLVVEFRDAVHPIEPVAEDVLSARSGRHRSAAYLRRSTHQIKRVAASVKSSENLLNAILDAHLGQIAMWQNEDMRRISGWAATIAAPTLIAGVYGMNFTYMPELHWVIGYPLAVILMATACLLLYRGFRRNGWL